MSLIEAASESWDDKYEELSLDFLDRDPFFKRDNLASLNDVELEFAGAQDIDEQLLIIK